MLLQKSRQQEYKTGQWRLTSSISVIDIGKRAFIPLVQNWRLQIAEWTVDNGHRSVALCDLALRSFSPTPAHRSTRLWHFCPLRSVFRSAHTLIGNHGGLLKQNKLFKEYVFQNKQVNMGGENIMSLPNFIISKKNWKICFTSTENSSKALLCDCCVEMAS